MTPERPDSTALLQVGPYELWPAGRRLRLHGKAVALTPRAFDVLAVLAAHHPGMVGKSTLLAAVWPGLIVEENNLQVQISLLRKLLGRHAIATVPGHGYRLTLPVSARDSNTATGAPGPACGELHGRAGDLAELDALMRGHRLTSLLGGPGVGKSALSRHAAVAMAEGAGLALVWADLADCAHGTDLLETVARVGGLDGAGTATPQALARHLAQRPTLLVLDNSDRVARDTAQLVDELLARVAALRVLVTTQVRLHLPEEQVYRLTPLVVPPAGCGLDDAQRCGALALLAARAQGHDHRFTLNDDTLPAAIELCRQLDGVPLALELAAARIPALGVAGLLQRLRDDPLPLLAKANGTGPARHRSLQDALEWSYRLLDGDAQALWCDTAAMPPGFSLEALMAQRAGRDVGATLDVLGTLVDRSLLVFDARTPGYSLGETQRAFALRKRAVSDTGV